MFRPYRLIATLLWLAAFAFGPPATAAIVNYTFSVEVTSGPLIGQTLIGSFSFDDQAQPPAIIDGLFPLMSFRFDFDAATFALDDLEYGDAAFADGSFIGLDAAADATFSFLPAIAPLPAAFNYVSAQQSGDGNPSFIPVPEPAAGLLAAAAFGALWVGRRRRPTGS